MDRREFLRCVGVGAATVGLGGLSGCVEGLFGGKSETDRPNILFIMSDDHASHALSCYGSVINRTPNLDRIADEGMRFDNCFCTNSICAPSRAVILTGKYSHVNGHVNNALSFDGSQETFPKILQRAGYQTAMIGKWHLQSTPTGFDHYSVLDGQGTYYDPVFIEKDGRVTHKGYVTDIITDKCLEWIDGRDKSRPFCVIYQHKAPHSNWQSGPKHKDMYKDVDIPEPRTLNDDYATRSAGATDCDMSIEKHIDLQYPASDKRMTPPEGLTKEERKKWKYQAYIKDYLRCVASVDDNVGRVLDYLEANGLAENTVVVYTSDQGFFLGDHGMYDKRFMYEESLRMPLLVRYPKMVKAGSESEAMVLNLDFAATALDLAGVEVPGDMQGESMVAILKGKTPVGWRKSMYYHYYEYPGWHMVKRHYGVRTRRYKLIHFYYDIDAWEMYDLEKDPDEVNNVYGDAGYGVVVKELKAELKRLQKKYGDSDELAKEFITKYPGFYPGYHKEASRK